MIFHLLSTNLLWALCLLSLPVKWVCSPDCTKCVSVRNGFRRHPNSVAYSTITDLEHLIKNIQLPLTSRPTASLKWYSSSVSSCVGLHTEYKKGEKCCIYIWHKRVFIVCIFLQIFFFGQLRALTIPDTFKVCFTLPVEYWCFICPISCEWNESDTSSSSTCSSSILSIWSWFPIHSFDAGNGGQKKFCNTAKLLLFWFSTPIC